MHLKNPTYSRYMVQIIVFSSLMGSQIIVALILAATLRSKVIEESITLHRASLIMRSYSDNELILIY